ncbi:histidine phosphotransferase family protein [Frigidibacter sp. MR17.14]|uniref:histidine phosphotransferase family protein n=1 Tax=Frigidibacter sp. MR17.14 TaxID=3126509 RepID=UPI003013182C
MTARVPLTAEGLLPLLGSRICHDLISPLGAISNGLELLQMAGLAGGAEIDLISQSVAAANAKVKFYRLAFGAGSAQRIAGTEIAALLAEISSGGRMALRWQGERDATRAEVKLALLALQCLETAMPWGGTVTLAQAGRDWTITGTAERMKIDTALWALLDTEVTGSAVETLSAAQVQFGLLALEARLMGRALDHSIGEGRIEIRF